MRPKDRSATTAVTVRAYREDDLASILELLDVTLGGGPAGRRPPEYFRWKHLLNPFGRSFMLVAEADDRIVGLRAFMRWDFDAHDRRFRAVRAVDTATHPDYQGRGIFSRLTLQALDALREEADFVFNTPNEKSLPGYLKMGWRVVGRVPVYVRVRRPIRFAAGSMSWRTATETRDIPMSSAPLASDVLAADDLDGLLGDRDPPTGIATIRNDAYLRWRYAEAPLLGYRAVVDREQGRLRALAIFRIRPRGSLLEATVPEVIVRAGDVRSAGRVLRATGRSAPVDHLACSFSPGSTALRAARRGGFLRTSRGVTLVVNDLGHRLDPDPLDLRSWALTAGDLEVF